VAERTAPASGPARPGVVVTGASTGIGFDAARELAARGFQAFGTVRRPEDGAALERVGATPIVLDVTDEAGVRSGLAAVSERLAGAPLAGLVNNAGVSCAGPVELLRLEDFRRVFEVNVVGVVAVTQAFLPLLKQSKGRIVNISSVSGRLAAPFAAPYAASKFALEAISDCLRRELYPFGIDVIVIQPGNVDTPIWQKGAAQDTSPARGTVYEPVLEKLKAQLGTMQRHAMPPSRVSRAIVQALTDPRPPSRILVVKSSLRQRMLRFLPDRFLDRKIARRLWRQPRA
jgi:NAD(P)-dependent dehydrogenase (short-subunit alcohol dehydrogenase family)